eukprot:scaffold267039_cov21-Tisochrysis_lutea.AAC.1
MLSAVRKWGCGCVTSTLWCCTLPLLVLGSAGGLAMGGCSTALWLCLGVRGGFAVCSTTSSFGSTIPSFNPNTPSCSPRFEEFTDSKEGWWELPSLGCLHPLGAAPFLTQPVCHCWLVRDVPQRRAHPLALGYGAQQGRAHPHALGRGVQQGREHPHVLGYDAAGCGGGDGKWAWRWLTRSLPGVRTCLGVVCGRQVP